MCGRPGKRQTPPGQQETVPEYKRIPTTQKPSQRCLGASGLPFRTAGAALAILSALAALGLLTGTLCFGGACAQEAYLWGRPLSAWGAAVYILTAVCFMYARRFVLVPWTAFMLLAHGVFYLSGPVLCLMCVGTLAAEVLMVALAALAGPPGEPSPPGVAAAAAASVLVLAFAPGPPADYALPVMDRGSFEAERVVTPGAPAPARPKGQETRAGSPASASTLAASTAPAWDRAVVPGAQSRHVRLVTPDGEAVFVDLRTSPVVVFSASCKRCDRALEAVAHMEPKPVLAVTQTGGVAEKLAAAGLSGAEWYVLPEPVQGVPALIYWDGGRQVVIGASAVLALLQKSCFWR